MFKLNFTPDFYIIFPFLAYMFYIADAFQLIINETIHLPTVMVCLYITGSYVLAFSTQ